MGVVNYIFKYYGFLKQEKMFKVVYVIVYVQIEFDNIC